MHQNDAISKYMTNIIAKPAINTVVAEVADSVELSEGAQKFATLLKSVKETMDGSEKTEEAKVADIMAKMNSNSYSVPTGDVVKSILSGIDTYI